MRGDELRHGGSRALPLLRGARRLAEQGAARPRARTAERLSARGPRALTPRAARAQVMREYALDMNWLRLWALNGNDNGPGSSVLRNPDLVPEGTGARHLFVGVTYAAKPGEDLAAVAARMRTTVKSILSLNFDVDGERPLAAGQELCVIPCSSFALV